LNIGTTAKSALPYVPWKFPRTPLWIGATAAASALLLIFFVAMPRERRHWRVAFAAMALAAMTGLAGCGSSGANPGTTPDTYTIAVMATSGSTTQPATFTLTVQ
jgi:hypothetical protein